MSDVPMLNGFMSLSLESFVTSHFHIIVKTKFSVILCYFS